MEPAPRRPRRSLVDSRRVVRREGVGGRRRCPDRHGCDLPPLEPLEVAEVGALRCVRDRRDIGVVQLQGLRDVAGAAVGFRQVVEERRGIHRFARFLEHRDRFVVSALRERLDALPIEDARRVDGPLRLRRRLDRVRSVCAAGDSDAEREHQAHPSESTPPESEQREEAEDHQLSASGRRATVAERLLRPRGRRERERRAGDVRKSRRPGDQRESIATAIEDDVAKHRHALVRVEHQRALQARLARIRSDLEADLVGHRGIDGAGRVHDAHGDRRRVAPSGQRARWNGNLQGSRPKRGRHEQHEREHSANQLPRHGPPVVKLD